MFSRPAPSSTARCVSVWRRHGCYISSSALSPCRVKLWASAFGGEIKSIAAKYSGSQLLQKVRFLWWQTAMIFLAQKMEADLVFPNKREPRAASVIRVVSDLQFLALYCAVTFPYQPVIFRWHLILNTKKSRILTRTVLAGAGKQCVCTALLSVDGIAVSVREQMLPWPKDANFIRGAGPVPVFWASFLTGVMGFSVPGRYPQHCLSSCSCTISLFPNHLDPGLGCITSLQIRRMNVVIFPLSCTAG